MSRSDKKLHQCLKKHRELMNLSQGDVAERLQLESTAMISRWERGETLPTLENAIRLSVLYKTFLNELFPGLFSQIQKELFPDERKTTIDHNNPENGP